MTPRLAPLLVLGLLCCACAAASSAGVPQPGGEAPRAVHAPLPPELDPRVPDAPPGAEPPRRLDGAAARAPAWSRARTPCPADLRPEPALETGPDEAPAAGEYLAPERRAALAHAGARPFARTLALAAGRTEVLGWVSELGASLLVLRPHEAGACVVNGWGTYFDERTELALADAWTAPDGGLAVLLLRVGAKAVGSAAETRWVVLATDGRRVWPAFSSGGRIQARVPRMALQERQGQLQLAVTLSRTSLYAFDRKRGSFVTPEDPRAGR